ncbi:DNA polymerase III subunit gamma and tau [Actinoplanes sp. TBRC 11911]|uniref:DNA polymerase III subunit gamma and tau n=1 Tax=Actinoplanes sp. TBRC 11911 TaxID=2729386 RepID=UPI00145D9AFA|nr:DNA polymerase III subunit gamma and tau [Actinoplanes sp. TBRC 11911]NMO52237.1 DNA polymerase III subunit gamma and tau [Actinoplanes sp. TBRC 11911]
MALALYRKYRPRTFAELIGQEHVTEPLSQALRSGRLHHAYLFSGPRGCGKTSSARILARSLNCEQGPTPEPCGVCASCRALANDGPGSIDVIEIDAASHGGVDDARDLREKAFFAPASSRYKIYVIDEAHMVSSAGFNALLKLVEEPPEYVKFIFATTEPEKVLGTIKSRTHHYPFRLIPPAVLRPYLQQLTEAEGVAVEPAVFPLVVRAGGGSARDTLSVLDQLIAGAGPDGVSYSRAVSLLGVTDVALIDEMCDALAAGDGAAAYSTIDRVAEAGHDARRFASDLLERFRDLIILQQVPDAVAKGLIDGPADQVETMSAQATRLGPATLSRCADIMHNGLVEMRGTTAPRLLLELITARMLLPGADDSSGALLQRLERIERRLTLSGDSPVRVEAEPAVAASNGSAVSDGAVAVAGGPAGAGGGGLSAARAAAAAAGRRSAGTGAGGGGTAGAAGRRAPAAARPAAPTGDSGDQVEGDDEPVPAGQAEGGPSDAAAASASAAVALASAVPATAASVAASPVSASPSPSAEQITEGLSATAVSERGTRIVEPDDYDDEPPWDSEPEPPEPSHVEHAGVSPEPARAEPAGVSPVPSRVEAVGASPELSRVEPDDAPREARRVEPAGVMPDAPEEPAAAALEDAVPGQLTAAAVREVWPEIVAAIGRQSKRLSALLAGAVVRDFDGRTVTLTFRYPKHAEMVAPASPTVADALYEALGGRWEIRCEVSGDGGATSPAPAPRNASGRGASGGRGNDAGSAGVGPGRTAPTAPGAQQAAAPRPPQSRRREADAPASSGGDDDWPEPAKPGGLSSSSDGLPNESADEDWPEVRAIGEPAPADPVANAAAADTGATASAASPGTSASVAGSGAAGSSPGSSGVGGSAAVGSGTAGSVAGPGATGSTGVGGSVAGPGATGPTGVGGSVAGSGVDGTHLAGSGARASAGDSAAAGSAARPDESASAAGGSAPGSAAAVAKPPPAAPPPRVAPPAQPARVASSPQIPSSGLAAARAAAAAAGNSGGRPTATNSPAQPAAAAGNSAARAAAGGNSPARGAAAGNSPTRGAAGAKAGNAPWADGGPAEEAPYDPEYDGPPPRGSFEGFDPGDEPLDDVIDEKTARESSEQQAMRLLQDAFGAEKIGEV